VGVFNPSILTEKGRALVAKAVMGVCDITFTKIAVSESHLTGDLRYLTDIGAVKQSANVSSVTRTGDIHVKVGAGFSNEALSAGYYIRNLGLFAQDPDEGEILYSVSVADEREAVADWMPSASSIGVSSIVVDMYTSVANTASVTLTVDPAGLATAAQITEVNMHLAALDNTITTTTEKTLKGSVAGGLKVNSVGGTARKCTNLLKPTGFGSNDTGVTLSYGTDGTSVILNGTATKNGSVHCGTVTFGNADYVLSGGTQKCGIYIIGSSPDNLGGATIIYNEDKNSIRNFGVYIKAGETYSDYVVYPMLNEGTEPLPYEPYFESLRSVEINKIETHNKNLFDHTGANVNQVGLNFVSYGEYVKINGTKVAGKNVVTLNNKEVVLPAGTYTISLTIVSGSIAATSKFDGIMCAINHSDYAQRSPGVFNVGETESRSFTLDTDTVVSSFDVIASYNGEGTVFTDVVVACQLERSDTATDFTPYKENSITLSQPITLNGIPVSSGGNTIDENGQRWLCDELDLEKKQFVKRVKKITVTADNIASLAHENYYGYINAVANIAIDDNVDVDADEAMNYGVTGIQGYSVMNASYYWVSDKAVGVGSGQVAICNKDFSTIDDFKALCPFDVVYPIEPVIVDISDILPIADQISFHSLLAHDEVTHLFTDSKENPVIEVEYGTNKTGAHTLTGLLTAQRNELKLAELTTAVLALNQE
jgi:hypothetical protein